MMMNNEKFLSTLKTCEGDEELDEVLVEHALHDRDHDHLGTIVIMMTSMVTRMTLMTLTDDNNSKNDTHPKDATE